MCYLIQVRKDGGQGTNVNKDLGSGSVPTSPTSGAGEAALTRVRDTDLNVLRLSASGNELSVQERGMELKMLQWVWEAAALKKYCP